MILNWGAVNRVGPPPEGRGERCFHAIGGSSRRYNRPSTIGAAGSGAIYDFKGATGVFGASSLVLFVAAIIALFAVPKRVD